MSAIGSILKCLAVVACLLAPAGASAQKVRTLVMDLKPNGVDGDTVETISGLIAVILDENDRLEVLSGADVRQLIALESQKQAIGCDDNSCLADVAGAMGAELVVFGNAGRLGSLYNLNINLFDSVQARSVGRVAVQAGSLEALPAQLRPALQQLVKRALADRGNPGGADVAAADPTTPGAQATAEAGAPGDVAPAPPATAGAGPGALPLAVAGGGAAALLVGVGALAFSYWPGAAIGAAQEDYRRATSNEERAAALAAADAWQGPYDVLVPTAFFGGLALAAAGAAGLVAGGVWAATAAGSAE